MYFDVIAKAEDNGQLLLFLECEGTLMYPNIIANAHAEMLAGSGRKKHQKKGMSLLQQL